MILLYRILTYLLLPFAALFALFTLATFIIAFSNPALFLGVFMVAGFVIYTYCSMKFLQVAVLRKSMITQKLRDWLRVNAYVALPFGISNFMQSTTLIRNPALIAEINEQILEMQQKMGLPPQTPGAYNSMIISLFYVLGVFAVCLLVHILITFSLMKKHEDLVEPTE